MNLWVRNQDKTIFQKVDNLLISDGDNEEGTFNIYTNSLLVQNVLGRYKTKERALEVLDEIQRKIEDLYALENCSLEKNSCIERSLVMHNFNIYQMPKE